MAAKLPSVLDYGARDRLSTNRIDMPGRGGEIIGDAVLRAGEAVSNAIAEHEQSENRLQSALTESELIQADIAAREALKDRTDHENFDDAYTEDFQTRADEIFEKRKLPKRARAISLSKSDLIREKGRVYAGDLARSIRGDVERAEIDTALAQSVESYPSTAPEQQNDLMKNALELIRGGIESFAFDEEQGLAKAQEYVSKIATNSLAGMDPKIRLAELQIAKQFRKEEGALTRDQILNNEGSDSIGDFLTTAQLDKLIGETEKEVEIDEYQGLAFETSDEAWRQFPDPGQVKERDAYGAETLRDHPKARKEFHLLSSQRRERMNVDDAMQRGDISKRLTETIYRTEGLEQLNPNLLARLSRPEQEAIEKLQKRMAEGHEWAATTAWDARELWDDMSPAERAATDFDGFMHRNQDQTSPEGKTKDGNGNIINIPWRAVVAKDRADYMSASRGLAKNGTQLGGDYDGLTQTQVLHDALIKTPFFDKKPGASPRDKEKRERWAEISDTFNRALIAADKAGITVDSEKRLEILGRVLQHEVYTTEGVPDERRLYAGLAPEDYPEAYIPIDQTVILAGQKRTIADPIPVPSRYGGGTAESAHAWIKNTMESLQQKDPSTRDIEEAWFYLVTQGWDAAYSRMAGHEDF